MQTIRMSDVEKVCPCCGHLFIGHKNKKYCTECRHLKYYVDRQHGGYKKRKREIANDIKISDQTFVSDCGVPGMDCEHCPLPDCVLDCDYNDVE